MVRGRPNRSDVQNLINLGVNDESKYKCSTCWRCFERKKNLKTHELTHNDEKNYICDYPTCDKKFVQSNQLKVHKYIHSREKPFICAADGCMKRLRHTNRRCTNHHKLKLIKQPEKPEEIRSEFYKNEENLTEEKKTWLEAYISEKERKCPSPPIKRQNEDFTKIEERSKKKKPNNAHFFKSSSSPIKTQNEDFTEIEERSKKKQLDDAHLLCWAISHINNTYHTTTQNILCN